MIQVDYNQMIEELKAQGKEITQAANQGDPYAVDLILWYDMHQKEPEEPGAKLFLIDSFTKYKETRAIPNAKAEYIRSHTLH